MCYQLIAAKDLCIESLRVYDALNADDLPAARRAVSMIVGRDTEDLTQSGVTKAAVETVAENASDGVIAPLFFLALGGAPLGFFYKAVNTLDSMVGYQNECYMDFGRWSARLDDLLNWIPARVSALLMIAGGLLRLGWTRAAQRASGGATAENMPVPTARRQKPHVRARSACVWRATRIMVVFCIESRRSGISFARSARRIFRAPAG